MNLKDSVIVTTTLTKLFPLVVLFSLYLMSYGGAYPGGGFQGGVILGTMIVITEAALEKRLFSDRRFRYIELAGVLILVGLLWIGWWRGRQPFGGLYAWTTPSLALGNVMIWLLGFAIYLEVAGSMVLIFRRFLFWDETALPGGPGRHTLSGDDPDRTGATCQHRRNSAHAVSFRLLTALLLATLGAAILLLAPPLTFVFHDEVTLYRHFTEALGIRNMVTTVYLGPRLIDTMLECFVVLLTVFGLRTMGETS